MSEEVETLGEAPPLLNYRLPMTVENYDIYVLFLFRDLPSPSFWIRPWYVCMYVLFVWGLVVKWFVHWAHDPWVMGSSPTTRRWILSNLLPLPPTTPTSPPSCEWVPGISWGANHSSFSLNSSGPGGILGAHTTCCERVAGPPSPFSRSLLAWLLVPA